MYFYVFIQPEIFEEAVLDGEDATQIVDHILNEFRQNCFLTIFEDDHWGTVVKEKLERWPETMTRKRVMSMLVHLKKQNRFLYCLAPDYIGEKSDLDCVFEQASSICLDLILVIASEGSRRAPQGVEVSTRSKYLQTAFESRRSDIAVYGKTCKPGDLDAVAFMEFHFAKALKYATIINICDRICGAKNFADNFRYTTKQLLSWLGTTLDDPKKCKLIFHIGQPKGAGEHHIKSELASCKNGPLSDVSFELRFYNEALPDPSLPHQRFIVTDQIALDIDRGLDFLDKNTHKCRDTYINYQKPSDAQKLLDSYSSGCVSIHSI